MQRAVTKHISGMRGLTYEQRLVELGLTTLEARRTRGDLIFTYQHLRRNALVDLTTWHWAQSLTEDVPASRVRANIARANDVILNPPVRYECQQREHFLTTRVAAPLRHLPHGLMNVETVNLFKQSCDKHSIG